MDKNILKLRELINKFRLDAIIIYANGYEDSFFKAVTGTFSILQDHIVITQRDVFVSTPSYLVPELEKRTNMPILPAEGESLTILPILKKLGKNKRIGIAGFFKFSDLKKLSPSFIIDLNPNLSDLIKFKSDDYIDQMAFHTKFLSKTINELSFYRGINQLNIKRLLDKKFAGEQFNLAFPILIISGEDLKKTTSLSASNKMIEKNDVVCVDVGIKKEIFVTDMARMFFVNNKNAMQLYKFIKDVHEEIIAEFLTPETRFSEIISEYKKRVRKNREIIKVLEKNFGHGIGFSLHEKPMVEDDQGIIGKNIVFTLEPTFVTKFGLMRIEDMIAIKSDGKVLKLT